VPAATNRTIRGQCDHYVHSVNYETHGNACRVPSAHLYVTSLDGFSEKLSQCGGADNGAMTLQHIRNVVEPVTNGVLEINSGSSQPQSRHDTHNYLTQRDTLCSCEAFGMRPTHKEKTEPCDFGGQHGR
jgi:hypothetical protein